MALSNVALGLGSETLSPARGLLLGWLCASDSSAQDHPATQNTTAQTTHSSIASILRFIGSLSLTR